MGGEWQGGLGYGVIKAWCPSMCGAQRWQHRQCEQGPPFIDVIVQGRSKVQLITLRNAISVMRSYPQWMLLL